jgi:hypothetical protein
MLLYSAMLIVLNRRWLPPQIRVRSYRLAALIWSMVFFGVLAGLTFWQQALRFI